MMFTRATVLPWLTGAVVVALAFAGGIALSIHQAGSGGNAQIDGLLWPDPPQLAAFNLIDDAGQPFTREDLRGKWSLIFFGFTQCPDVCPTTLDTMARAARALSANERFAERGQVVFVSVDPDRDTQTIVHNYVRHFSPDFIGITGGEEELKALTRSLGVLYLKVTQGTGQYTMDHSAGIFFVSPQTQLVSVLTPPLTDAEIITRFNAVSEFIESQQ